MQPNAHKTRLLWFFWYCYLYYQGHKQNVKYFSCFESGTNYYVPKVLPNHIRLLNKIWIPQKIYWKCWTSLQYLTKLTHFFCMISVTLYPLIVFCSHSSLSTHILPSIPISYFTDLRNKKQAPSMVYHIDASSHFLPTALSPLGYCSWYLIWHISLAFLILISLIQTLPIPYIHSAATMMSTHTHHQKKPWLSPHSYSTLTILP